MDNLLLLCIVSCAGLFGIGLLATAGQDPNPGTVPMRAKSKTGETPASHEASRRAA